MASAFTPFGVAAAIGVPAEDNVGIFFGTGSDAVIKYDGTNLVIDPKVVGSGIVDLNGANMVAMNLGLGSSAINAAFVINASVTDAVHTRAFSATLTYSGSGSAMRALSFTAAYAGSSASGSPIGGILAASLDVATNGNSTLTGLSATATINAQQSAGIKTVRGITGQAVDVPGTHTGGTANAASIVGFAPSAFTGFATINLWAGLFDYDVQLSTGSKLILEGNLTTKGDSYFVFDTTTANKIQVAIDGTVSLDIRAATLNLKDGFDVVLGTSTGTKFGTATTQKLAFFNATPVVQPAAYTPSNVTTDRSYNANATTLDEVADVLGTLIADLQSLGLVG